MIADAVPAGSSTSVMPGDDIQCFTYDGLQQLTQAWTESQNTPANTPTASGNCTASPTTAGVQGVSPYWQSYQYINTTGNRSAVANYATSVTGSTTTTDNYAFGGAGPHQLTSVSHSAGGTAGYTYLGNGNLQTSPAPGGTATLTYSYDTESRLAGVTSSAGGTPLSRVYTADGSLLTQTDPTGTTFYLGDSQVTTSPTGATTALRGYSALGQPQAQRLEQTPSGGTPTESLDFLVTNTQGTAGVSVDARTDATSYRYFTPFGATRSTPAAQPSWPSTNRGFLNAPADPTLTGLTHLGARDYDPILGRFTTVDPILEATNPQQENGYSYASNSPVTNADATGLLLERDGGVPDCSNSQCVKAAEDTSRMTAINSGIAPMTDQQMCDSLCNFGNAGDFVGGLVNVVNDIRRSVPTPVNMLVKDPIDDQALNRDFGWDSHSAMFNIGQVVPLLAGGPETDTAEAATVADGLDATGASIPTATKAAESQSGLLTRLLTRLKAINWGDDAGAVSWGRGGQKLSPDPEAGGAPHTTFRRGPDGEITHYVEWTPNANSPRGYDIAKRYDGIGGSHYDKATGMDVPTPHVQGPWGVRPAEPWEIP